ncbi:MAG TPA: type VI secretion protein IcmF/TssM N-terminal domain-containing protein, partial [Longimicrobiaceae bacterium]|nr:type VI secretion protein IcmF/TssM N-terminal domain-containing protein [Longimicrobiaceae bacterium]
MFSRLLLALAAHWVAVMIVTGASVALVIGLVAWQLRKGKRAARPAPEPMPEAEPEVEVAILPPMALPGPRQIRHTVARGFAMLRERVTNRSLRYRTPCFLLIGPAGSGKSTLLRELRPEALAPSDPTDALGCRWHFFDRAVAIEIDGRLLHSDQQPAASHQGWLAMHRALRFHRPERPIDGVVLTIPASDLLGPRRLEGSALTARARALFKRLQSAQRILGVRVPLYVVVTKCDLLQGFQDLCTTIPSNMRGESFGWANPYALETAFAPEWIDEAFESLTADLLEVQMELLARGSAEQPEGLFQFSGNFRALQAPVRTFTAELCRESAYQESFFFRGLYFTGDGTPDPGERLLDAPYGYDDTAVEGGDEGTGSSALPAFPATLAVSREPYFLQDLFTRKIFGEAGLARPVAKSKLSRNRAILAMQAAIVAILLIGGVGLWRADVVLQREGGLLISVLSDIQSDLRLMNTDAPGSNAGPSLTWTTGANNRVFPLLSSMARVNESRLASFFVPSSWASSLHWDISESMRQGFTNVVLPSMYSAMLAKADSIVAPNPSDVEHGATTLVGGGDLPHYLSSVALLGRNLERYDTVAFIGAEDTGLKNVAELVQYLFNEQLPPEFMQNQRYHRTALWESYGQRITAKQRPFYSKRVVDRAEVLLRAYYDSLAARLQDVNDRFQDAEEVQRLTPEELADFRRLRDELVQVKSALDGSEPFWFDESKPVGPSLLAILDSIPATPLTHPDSIQHDFEQMFYRVRRE